MTTIIINGMLARALGGKEKKKEKTPGREKKNVKKTAAGVCEGSVDGSAGRVRDRFKSPARALGPGDPSFSVVSPEGARRGARRRVYCRKRFFFFFTHIFFPEFRPYPSVG